MSSACAPDRPRRAAPAGLRTAFLAVIVLLLVPAEGVATRKAIWGPTRLPDGSSAFPVYRTLGVDVFQVQLPWSAVARRRPADPSDPADPAYEWTRGAVDDAVAQAGRHGISVAVMVKGTPDWANGGRGVAHVPDANADYARFLTAAARRYPSVRLWMVWGEADSELNFGPLPAGRPAGPRRYATLLDAAYRSLKRSSRRNIVIGGMTHSLGQVRNSDFLRWLRLPDGRLPRMDWWGHNAFGNRAPDLRRGPLAPGRYDFNGLDDLARGIRRTFRGSRRPAPRIWVSEFTISSDRPTRAFDFFVSRREQARWITSAFRAVTARPRWFAGLGWFTLLDEPRSTPRGLTNGLMTHEGRRKPAFRAYRRAR